MSRPTLDRALEQRAASARALADVADGIERAAAAVVDALAAGQKVLLFGNGGSAADAQHIAAELVGRFVIERAPFPAIALTTDTSALTAIGNDYGFDEVFARQVRALGRAGDVAVAISTSGRSPNVLSATRAATAAGLRTIALTGGDGGELATLVDVALVVASPVTALIQESHIAIGHIICELVDEALGGDGQ